MVVARLAGIQRMACLAITGAFPSAPGAALDCCLNLAPLDIVIRAMARRSAYCLQQMGLWSGCSGGHCRISTLIQEDALHMISDQVIGLITGHGHLRKHLHRVGILQEDPLCRRCNEQEETAEHLLFDCPAIARERYAIFGSLDRGGEFSQEDLIGCFRRFVELLKL
ncbi:hypothetical protein J6590_041140 [Homalodisca vitripennis]|nr:hypothetical protein J6590_041140 [Homalodisca vitripennis]